MESEINGANHRNRKPLTLPDLIRELDLRFKSSNEIPVSRASLLPEEWALLRSAIKRGEPA